MEILILTAKTNISIANQIHFNKNPNLAFHFDANPDPDQNFHVDTDPDTTFFNDPGPDPYCLPGVKQKAYIITFSVPDSFVRLITVESGTRKIIRIQNTYKYV
jgi:hypothetical protein